jgi:hypothetical protein
MKEKARILGQLDSLSFDFVDQIKNQAAARSSAWLWQLTEPLPLLVEEPVAVALPLK